MNKIAGYATYVPRRILRRESAVEAWPGAAMAGRARAVPGLDEDPVTMGAEAALAALHRADRSGRELSGIYFASTSSPYVVKSAAAVLADYLGADRSVSLFDLGAGTHAGLLALVTALRDRDLADRGPLLVVGADALFGQPGDPVDLGLGAAAAAYVVDRDGFASLADFDSRYSSFTATWQATGDRLPRRYDDDRFERAAGYRAQMTDSLKRLLGRAGTRPDWIALQLAGNGDGLQVARAAGVGGSGLVAVDLASRLGDSGCANALIALACALDRATAGQTVAVQAYGSGAGTVGALLRVEAASEEAASRKDWTSRDAAPLGSIELSYLDYARHRGVIPVGGAGDFGSPYAASPAWERSKASSVTLTACRCVACGSLNFPRRAYCLDCRGEEFTDMTLPRHGSVVTFNLQYVMAISPELAPLPICTVLLDGEDPSRYGGKVAALATDSDPGQMRVGTRVELVPRRGDVEDGLVKYGWKFRALDGTLDAGRTLPEPLRDHGVSAVPAAARAAGRPTGGD